MKTKKLILFITFLSLIIPFSINAEEKNGWSIENNETYYYENGKKVSGFKEIDGETYFFGLTTNKMLKGWQTVPEGRFYLNNEGKIQQGWNEIKGEKYYVENNYMVSGFKEIDGETYFFGLTTNKMLKGWQAVPEGRFYLNSEGKIQQGWNEIKGEKYYVENNYMVSGFKEIDGETYFFGLTTNKMLKGWQAVPEGRFYLNSEGKIQKGWNEIDNEKYYVENNYMVSGFKEIDGETYFFGLTTNKMLKGWQAVPEGRFYLNNEGQIQQGWNEISGEKYYVENNYMVSGFKEIDGETYFFGLTTNKMLKGWQTVAEGRFYLNSEGKIQQGWNEIKGEKYYVENNYMVSGFKEIDGETYFFGLTTNKMLKGWQTVAEGRFYLNNEGKIQQGWNEIDNEKYYVENNFMISGFKDIDGKRYFFGLTTKKLLHGWNDNGKNYWYQDTDGAIVTGNQNIEGRDYLFSMDGFLQGFKFLNGNMYYYNPDGTQAKGVQRMAGKYFKFDSLTGKFERYVNQKIVIDVSSHNGNINWEQVKNAGIIDGVILRLGYSVGFVDTCFLHNVNELNRLGIPYSVYLFSYAVNPYEAGLEADFVIRTIKNNPVKIASNLFSIYYDLESWSIESTGENSYGISKEDYGGMITTFADKIKSNLGINARVYASKNYVYERFPSYAWPYATWIAQWGPAITYKEAFEGWQYTNNGSIPGINGRVDMSIFYY